MTGAVIVTGQLVDFATATLADLHTLVLRLDLPDGHASRTRVAVAHMAFGRGLEGQRARHEVLVGLHCGLHYAAHATGAVVHGSTLYLTGVSLVLPAFCDARGQAATGAAA